MPELPEVETSRLGITPHIIQQKITAVKIRQYKLRWPIPKSLPQHLMGEKFISIARRGKYLLLSTADGTMIIHLGMSGSLQICSANTAPQKHDHLDICFENNKVLRYTDPRKFGCILWSACADEHKLIKVLGVEPLNDIFNANYLFKLAKNRQCSIKSFIMNSHIVVGIGNIYACESLFLAKINPQKKAGAISFKKTETLVSAIKQTLQQAIEQGGTTLKDFKQADGKPGYFKQKLLVYGKVGLPCPNCNEPIKKTTQQQRSTFYCSKCQC